MKWSQEQLEEISRLQEQRNLTRKGAVQFIRRALKKQPVSSAKAELEHNKKVAASHPALVKPAAEKSGKPVHGQNSWAQLHGAQAVRLFKAHKSVPEIAEHFGDRTKQNRVRAALFAAGVYEYKRNAAKKSGRRK